MMDSTKFEYKGFISLPAERLNVLILQLAVGTQKLSIAIDESSLLVLPRDTV